MYGFNQGLNYPGYNYGTPAMPTQNTQDERIWVQNETAADSYLVAPNSFVRLWDASQNEFSEKRADATGRPFPLEAFEYTRRAPKTAVINNGSTIDYEKQIKGILERLEALERGRHAEPNANDTEIQ